FCRRAASFWLRAPDCWPFSMRAAWFSCRLSMRLVLSVWACAGSHTVAMAAAAISFAKFVMFCLSWLDDRQNNATRQAAVYGGIVTRRYCWGFWTCDDACSSGRLSVSGYAGSQTVAIAAAAISFAKSLTALLDCSSTELRLPRFCC